jgi:hypothetical protein
MEMRELLPRGNISFSRGNISFPRGSTSFPRGNISFLRGSGSFPCGNGSDPGLKGAVRLIFSFEGVLCTIFSSGQMLRHLQRSLGIDGAVGKARKHCPAGFLCRTQVKTGFENG